MGDSNDDDYEFPTLSDRVQTSRKRKKTSAVTSDSGEGDDEEFEKFLKKVKTTHHSPIKDKKNACKESSRKAPPSTRAYKLQKIEKSPIKKNSVKKRSTPKTVRKRHKTGESQETRALPKSGKKPSVAQMNREKEFKALFPPDTVNVSYLEHPASVTRKLYDFFNRKVFKSKLPGDMPVVWSGSLVASAGLTCCSRRDATCFIKLSSKLLISFDRMLATLLHEMCHAAVHLISRKMEQHGPHWWIWAAKCKSVLPFLDMPEECHTYEVDYKVMYKCPSCEQKIYRCKLVRKLHKSLCGKCKVPFECYRKVKKVRS